MARQSKPTADQAALRFRWLRRDTKEAMSWTDREFYAFVNISQNGWSAYENGRRPEWMVLERVALALDVTPTWIIFGGGEKSLEAELKRHPPIEYEPELDKPLPYPKRKVRRR